jgi:large subunit ribosomal protein L4
MKVAVRNLDNEHLREIELPAEVFAYPFKRHLIHTVVVAIQAARRAGTHQVKNRAAVSGSGRKPYRQKGTGRARAGSIRSPLARKGGTVFGPRPRDYRQAVGAQEKRNALRSALSRKLSEQKLLILDSLDLTTHRTSDLAQRLGRLGIDGKTLLVDRYDNEKLLLASRNNPALKAVDALGVNVYDVVDRPYLVISEGALGTLVEVLGP